MATASGNGRSLELYFVTGDPDGLYTARMFNWIGQVLVAPRTQLQDALQRDELKCTGVYLLLGERDGEPLAYIGESEGVGIRIRNHDLEKDWWTTALFITTAANELNKAHVKYLEARLVEKAREVGRMPLANGNNPARPSLSEAERGKMEGFLSSLMLVLPAVRVDMFVQRARLTRSPAAQGSALPEPPGGERFFLETRKHGLKASAVLDGGAFVVEAGSSARASWEGATTEDTGYARLHGELTRAGILASAGDHAVFTADYKFASASAAATVVIGRPANGATYWKTASGQIYKEWERQRLAG